MRLRIGSVRKTLSIDDVKKISSELNLQLSDEDSQAYVGMTREEMIVDIQKRDSKICK